MKHTTLCYIEKDGAYLLLHRVKKKADVNEGKWVGIGGHFEEGEGPRECVLREVREETGLTISVGVSFTPRSSSRARIRTRQKPSMRSQTLPTTSWS